MALDASYLIDRARLPAGVCAEVDEERERDEKPFETRPRGARLPPVPERGVRERGPRQQEETRAGGSSSCRRRG